MVILVGIPQKLMNIPFLQLTFKILSLLLQVDNPVSVLTQEMSKLFLQSKNEGDKYKVIRLNNL